jgi:hypothetical protein
MIVHPHPRLPSGGQANPPASRWRAGRGCLGHCNYANNFVLSLVTTGLADNRTSLTEKISRNVSWIRMPKAMFSNYDQIVYYQPDYRFFVDRGESREERVSFLVEVLEGFGNNREGISVFMERVFGSRDVAFAFVFGSVVNSNLRVSEIEDVDLFIVSHDRKFIHDWDDLKGLDTRYLRLSEIETSLRLKKRFFHKVFNREYHALGSIFSNGLLVLKSSKVLENIVSQVRRDFSKIDICALSQMVEYDCGKWLDTHDMAAPKRDLANFPKSGSYRFVGNETLLTFDEARRIIEEGIRRKNIQLKKGGQISRKIMKRIRLGRGRLGGDDSFRWR